MIKKRWIVRFPVLLIIFILLSQLTIATFSSVGTTTIEDVYGTKYSIEFIETLPAYNGCSFWIWQGTGPRLSSSYFEKITTESGTHIITNQHNLNFYLSACDTSAGTAAYHLTFNTESGGGREVYFDPPCSSECSPGETKCEGTTSLKTCTESGECATWGRPLRCASGKVCSNGECISNQPVCGDGSCDSSEAYSCHADCDWCGDGSCNAGETCTSCLGDCGTCKKSDGEYCYNADQCQGGNCVHSTCRSSSTHCGDGLCDPGENCAQENCCNGFWADMNYDENNCGSCGNKCGGDSLCSKGKCINLNSDSNCGWIGNRCASNKECVNKICRLKCGNGKKDSDENCKNCWKDAGCDDGQQACTQAGKCVDLDSDENCGRADNKCYDKFCMNRQCVECRTNVDCTTKAENEHTGRFRCANNKERYEILIKKSGTCRNNQCTGSTEVNSPDMPCPTICHQLPGEDNAICGCHEDYDVCNGKCLRKEGLMLNDPCECDFQCEERICDDSLRQCIKGLNVDITSSKATLDVGDETTISLSVANPLDEDVVADITLNLGDGVEIVDILSGDQCSGNQCKSDKTNIPAGGKKDITLKIRGSSDAVSFMGSLVTYHYGKKKIELEDATIVSVVQCGNGKVEEGETSETCCIDAGCPDDTGFYSYSCKEGKKSCSARPHGFLIGLLVVILIIVGSVIYFKKLRVGTDKIRLKQQHEKDMIKHKEDKAFATERRERFRIKKALKIVGDDVISKRHSPSVSAIKRRIKKKIGISDFNDKLLREEYMDFVNEKDVKYKSKSAEEKAKLKKEKQDKHKKHEKEEKVEKSKARKFCKKCGKKITPGSKFCKKCGARQRWF